MQQLGYGYGYGVFLLRTICYFQGTSTSNGNQTHDSTRLSANLAIPQSAHPQRKKQIVSGL